MISGFFLVVVIVVFVVVTVVLRQAEDLPANRRQAGEDDLDAKAVQAGENLDQFLAAKGSSTAPASNPQLTALTTENKELKVKARRASQEAAQAREALAALKKERDELRRQLMETAATNPRPLPLSAAASLGALSSFQGSPVHQSRLAIGGTGSRVSSPVIVEEGPVCKVAERVRIKRLEGRETGKLLTGSQIASLGVSPIPTAPQRGYTFFL